MDVPEALWRQYSMQVDLYKHYLKITIEFNVLYYAITGAILSYYLTHSSVPLIKYSLLLPLAMSVLFAGLFIYGAILMRISRDEVFQIRDQMGFASAPDFNVLSVLLWIFAALMVIVAIALIALLFTS